MRVLRLAFALVALGLPSFAATFGTVVAQPGGFADIVLDERRGRLYLVNTAASRIDIYQTGFNPPRAGNPIRTSTTPLSAAMSVDPDRKYLYVACYDAATLDVIDLDRLTSQRVTLAAKPEGVAVGGDGRVLISTIGTGQGQSTLIVYDPRAEAGNNLRSVVITPPAPTPPQLPPPSGRVFLSARSKLAATQDGRFIIGANGLANNTRTVFVYEVSSATVLRSRSVASLSNVLAVSPDGSKFMAGMTLFDTETLAVLGQQNAANAPFVFPSAAANNFNLQQNQGGSVFSPDGSILYTAFNIAPTQNPPARANISRLLLNDPDNLLVRLGLQLTENLVGKFAITSDGRTAYALSESGFVVLPLGTVYQQPIAMPDSRAVLLENDQCGVTAEHQAAAVTVRNAGGGRRMSVSAQLLQMPPTGPAGLGGIGGPGGGGTGGNIIILLPPVIPGAPGSAGRPGAPGSTTPIIAGAQQTAVVQTSPAIQTVPGPLDTEIRFGFNPASARALGTVSPHEILIQSNEAINIPPTIRVYQNNRNAEAAGLITPVEQSVSASEGLVDMLLDTNRQRLYIANSGMNRVEVFDLRRRLFLDPIKVGQLPRSLAFGTDGVTLYVANTNSEVISVVDLDRGQTVGRVVLPPLPFNAGFALIAPSIIASSQRGPQILMSDGTLWRVVGNTAVPRTLNPGVFGTTRTIPGPVRSMAATPEGRYVLLLAGNGNAYLYDAEVDDYITGRQVLSAPFQGYYGPIAAGPRGNYYLVNGVVLNQSLTPVGSAPSVTLNPGSPAPVPDPDTGVPVPLPGNIGGLPTRGAPVTVSRPVSAVAAVGNTTFARFSVPVRTNQNQLPSDSGVVEIVDVTSGRAMSVSNALEGPLASAAGNQRVNTAGRTMAVDPSGSTIYALTTSGISIIPVESAAAQNRPTINRNGVVNLASMLTSVAPGNLISIFGRNLSSDGSAESPYPTVLGSACVTLNNQPLPLLMTSPGQINAQIPPALAAGRYPLVVRAIDRHVSSAATTVSVSRYAPAVFTTQDGQPAIFHMDGRLVTQDEPAHRDEQLVIYAAGLGATKGGRVSAGAAAPDNPPALTDKVQVFFGNPGYRQAEMIVEWSGLQPGLVGVYQILIRVPGFRMRGEHLPVTLRIGGVNSPSAGPAVPFVAVD